MLISLSFETYTKQLCALPPKLESLKMNSYKYKLPTLPKSLTLLDIRNFEYPIRAAHTMFTFLCCSLKIIHPPPSLTCLKIKLVNAFNNSLPNLSKLEISTFKLTLDHLPPSITNLNLHKFNQSLDIFPPKLKSLYQLVILIILSAISLKHLPVWSCLISTIQ